MRTLTHLQQLEGESIHALREAVALSENPAMVSSGDEESTVLLRLAEKAFYPFSSSVPLLRIDSGPTVGQRIDHALDQHGFDLAIYATRRDGEPNTPAPQVVAADSAVQGWEGVSRRPALWRLSNARPQPGARICVFPLSHWTACDVREYIEVEGLQGDPEGVTRPPVDDGPAGERRLLRAVLLGDEGAGKDTLLRRLAGAGDGRPAGGPAVATRRISFGRREVMVAGTSGHEGDIRFVASGASNADVAVVVVDSTNTSSGATTHGHLASLFGITEVVVAVNKLDAAGWERGLFEAIASECSSALTAAGAHPICMPVSALRGDNVTAVSPVTSWYRGPTLLGYLETLDVHSELEDRPFRLTVQWGQPPGAQPQGGAGNVVSGRLRPGDPVVVLPSGEVSRVARVRCYDGDLAEAVPGQSVRVTLDDDAIVLAHGDALAAPGAAPEIADQFEADIVWLGARPMLPGRSYLLTTGARTVSASVADLKYRVDLDTMAHVPAKTLELGQVGVCTVLLDRGVVFEPYTVSRELGSFLMVDRFTDDTVAAGMFHFALRRAHNIHWQAVHVDKESRAALNGHRPCVVWFTGLSGAGKSTLADLLDRRLRAEGVHTYLLDGDNVRHGLNRDLGFTDADRVENIRRVAEVGRLMVDAGLVVLASFISPFRAERASARRLVDADEFCEVFVDTPLAVAEQRDRKGLYRKARAGQLHNFTGIDSPYERPEQPDVHINTTTCSPEQAVAAIVDRLVAMKVLRR